MLLLVALLFDAGRHHAAVRGHPVREGEVPGPGNVVEVQVDAEEREEVRVEVGLVVEDPADLRDPVRERDRPRQAVFAFPSDSASPKASRTASAQMSSIWASVTVSDCSSAS